MFIQTEATPNPATLKFIPGRPVLDQGTLEFLDPNASKASPLAARLFEIDGVKGVFFGTDFISVTKGDGEWQHLKPAILGAIMEHYLSGEAVTEGEQTGSESSAGGEFYAPEDEETVKTIKELLETRVRPAVAQDGGDITFQGYREGVGLPAYARRLLGLPQLDGDAPPRHRELAPALHPRGARGPAGLSGQSARSLLSTSCSARRAPIMPGATGTCPTRCCMRSSISLKLGPTSANCSPARFLFVKSREAKERLKPHLSEGNRDKTMKAPVCAIIGYDLDFYHHLPKLFPHADAKSWFEGNDGEDRRDRVPQRHAARRLSDHGGAGARARLRADVGLRQ